MWESTSEFPAPWEEMGCNAFPSCLLTLEQQECSRLGFSGHVETGFGVFGSPMPLNPSQPLEFARRRGMNWGRPPAAQATMDLWNKSVERVGKGRLLRPSIALRRGAAPDNCAGRGRWIVALP